MINLTSFNPDLIISIVLMLILAVWTIFRPSRLSNGIFWLIIIFGWIWMWGIKMAVGGIFFPDRFHSGLIAFLNIGLPLNLSHTLIAATPIWIYAIWTRLSLPPVEELNRKDIIHYYGLAGSAVSILIIDLTLYSTLWYSALMSGMPQGATFEMYALSALGVMPIGYMAGKLLGHILIPREGQTALRNAIANVLKLTFLVSALLIVGFVINENQKAQRTIEFYFKAKDLALNRKFNEAVGMFQEVLHINPLFAQAYLGKSYLMLGTIYNNLNHTDKAEEANKLAMRYKMDEDNNARIHFNQGIVFLKTKRPALAIQEFKLALSKIPQTGIYATDLDFYGGLIQAYVDNHQLLDALSVAKEAVLRQPTVDNYYRLADLYISNGQNEKARGVVYGPLAHLSNDYVKKIVQKYPSIFNADVYKKNKLLVIQNLQAMDGSKIVQYALKMIALDEDRANDDHVYNYLMMGYFVQGNMKKSYEAVLKAVALDPQNKIATSFKSKLEAISLKYFNGQMPEQMSVPGFSSPIQVMDSLNKS